MSEPIIDSSKNKAAVDLEAIAALQRSPGYAYLVRRLEEERDKQAAKVLDGNFTAEELLIEQRIYKVKRDAVKLIEQDAASCRSVLGTHMPEMPQD